MGDAADPTGKPRARQASGSARTAAVAVEIAPCARSTRSAIARKEGVISFEAWILTIGSLLLLMGLAYPAVQRLPITTPLVYLLIGVALGTYGVLTVHPLEHAPWLHRAAEIAVIVSLFTVGLKLRFPIRDRKLRPAFMLAFGSMVLTVGIVTLVGTAWLGLPLGAAVLLGAVLAPTDPVLASDVQQQDTYDRATLRVTLSAEAGLNDGTAFPFVMLGLGLLGLHDLGASGIRWWTIDVAWAIVGGLGLGAFLGAALGRMALWLMKRRQASLVLGEYLVLGLIGVTYGAALHLKTYGFLAVFAAGVALRAVERAATGMQPADDTIADAAAGRMPHARPRDPQAAPAYFAGALLATNEQLERILEVALVLIVGAALTVTGLSPHAWWFAPLLFAVIRPVAALPVLLAGRFTRFEFAAVAWFGVRGIGSVYYLMFAVEHGLPRELAVELIALTLSVIACSIVLHGISVTPLMRRYRELEAKPRR